MQAFFITILLRFYYKKKKNKSVDKYDKRRYNHGEVNGMKEKERQKDNERQNISKRQNVKEEQKVNESQRRLYPSARLPKCGLIRINGAIHVYASCESCESCIGWKS